MEYRGEGRVEAGGEAKLGARVNVGRAPGRGWNPRGGRGPGQRLVEAADGGHRGCDHKVERPQQEHRRRLRSDEGQACIK